MLKRFPMKKLVKITPYVFLFAVGFMLTYTKSAYALGVNDGTTKIATGLDNLVTKFQIIGPSAGAVGFGLGALVHGVSHDPQVQEFAKKGMKGAVVGGAGVFVAASIVGMAASAMQ